VRRFDPGRRRRRLREEIARAEDADDDAEHAVERQPWTVDLGHDVRLGRDLRRGTRRSRRTGTQIVPSRTKIEHSVLPPGRLFDIRS
jgi:hypothetical protein